jgi:phosphonate transport system substrate-binding protein
MASKGFVCRLVMGVFALSASLALAATDTKTPARTEITMGFNPAENVEVVEMNGKLLSAYMQKKTGLSVKTFVATDYTALIEALRGGRIDFAWLAPFSYVKAEKIADAKVLLKSVRKGKDHFFSAIITSSTKPFKTVQDLKGKSMAWVDPTSTSGHIMPKASVKKKFGIDPETFFGKQIFAGSHDALVLAVLNGTVDAGATFVNDKEGKEGAWNQLFKDSDPTKIRVLYVTEPIPGDTLCTSGKFLASNKTIVDNTVKILKDMGKNEEGKKILKALYRIDSLVPAKSEDYQSVRDAATQIDISAE